MQDDPEKIANASLHQRADLMAEIERLNVLLRSEGANRYWEGRWRDEQAMAQQLIEALIDIEELCDGYADIDRNGQPNLAMKIMAIINLTLKEPP